MPHADGGSDAATGDAEADGGDAEADGGDGGFMCSMSNCVTLAAPTNQSVCNGNVCQECAGTNVCGDGVHYGTMTGNSYVCTGGMIGAATACAYGCDNSTGKCADFVPASQAGGHVAANDTFTCTGTQAATLPAVTSPAMGTVAVNTTAQTITVNGTAVTGV
jgi:hypothetical protein